MSEKVAGSRTSLSSVCEAAVEAYRESGKSVQSPAIRHVLESVIHQKHEHVAVLRRIDPLYSGAVPPVAIPAGTTPEGVLQALVDHETAFAAILDALTANVEGEEPRLAVKSTADAGRKFASWAKDHLDLLSMF